jgi:cobalt-zinc-cadmium efflux system protein
MAASHHAHGHDVPHDHPIGDGQIHGHGHAGGPGHIHSSGEVHARGLRIALALTALFFVVEVAGGFLANSLALLADAGHMLTDVAALGLSLFVAWFSRQPETPSKTYGYLRWEILAAFLNGTTLLLISAWIISEAVLRLRHPEPVASGLMLGVAGASVVTNLASAWVLHGGSRASLNLRGAYIHVLGDLLGSVGRSDRVDRYDGAHRAWLVAPRAGVGGHPAGIDARTPLHGGDPVATDGDSGHRIGA